jgi:hypothetical protein
VRDNGDATAGDLVVMRCLMEIAREGRNAPIAEVAALVQRRALVTRTDADLLVADAVARGMVVRH